MSSFDLDLLALRAKAEAMDAVAAAELRVRSGGVLQVTITEREPMLVWRKDDARIEMLDAQGHRVAALAARQRQVVADGHGVGQGRRSGGRGVAHARIGSARRPGPHPGWRHRSCRWPGRARS